MSTRRIQLTAIRWAALSLAVLAGLVELAALCRARWVAQFMALRRA